MGTCVIGNGTIIRPMSILVGAVSLVLTFSPACIADPSWAKASIGIDVVAGPNVDGLVADSHSEKPRENGSSVGSQWNYIDVWSNDQVGYTQSGTVTSVSITTPYTFAHAETDWLHTCNESEVTVIPTITAWAEAFGGVHSYSFTARGQGEVTFDMSVPFTIDMATGAPGDWAECWLGVRIAMWGWVGGDELWPRYWELDKKLVYSVYDGDSYSDADTWTFSASSPCEFAPGQEAHLMIFSYAGTGAFGAVPIPLPGAALLGAIGLGYSGWRLRHRAS